MEKDLHAWLDTKWDVGDFLSVIFVQCKENDSGGVTKERSEMINGMLRNYETEKQKVWLVENASTWEALGIHDEQVVFYYNERGICVTDNVIIFPHMTDRNKFAMERILMPLVVGVSNRAICVYYMIGRKEVDFDTACFAVISDDGLKLVYR